MRKHQVELIPILEDNYTFLVKNLENKEAVVVDPGESSRLLNLLAGEELSLRALLLTHHHPDHIGGKDDFKAPAYAPLKNRLQIPNAGHYVEDNFRFYAAGFQITVMALPGHTLGISAYWFNDQHWLFSGDVLFGLGCGRLFEGTPEQGWTSLCKIKSLPDDTLVFCAHEYTETNLRFCKSLAPGLIPPENLAAYEKELTLKRSEGMPSVPLSLAVEKITNPFLLARSLEEFTELRRLRNSFR